MRKALFVLLLILSFLIGVAYATTFTYTYDTATPAGGDDPAEADDRMREIKAAVQERLAVEHRFILTGTEVSDANTGEHTDITTDSITNAGTLVNTGTITASGAVTVGTTLDVTGNIDPTTYETTNGGFLDEDAMGSDSNTAVASQQSIKAYVDAITDPAYSGGESHTFEGGLIFKHGTENVAGNATDTVTFAVAFPNAVISASATFKSTNNTLAEPAIASATTTKVDVTNCIGASAFDIYWQVWGY